MNQESSKTRQIIAAVIMLLAISGFSSCEKYRFTPPAVDPDAEWKLSVDIQPIFNASCVSCHGGAVSPDLREGKSFDALTKGGYVNPPADGSKLYSTMNSASHLPRSIESERLKVLYWITQGSQNN
jgi:mono/diheme cytochrome c family protein